MYQTFKGLSTWRNLLKQELGFAIKNFDKDII